VRHGSITAIQVAKESQAVQRKLPRPEVGKPEPSALPTARKTLDSGFRRNDEQGLLQTFLTAIRFLLARE
jgi:hypothetical protein